MVVENDLELMLSRLYEATLDPALWPAAWAEATSAAGTAAPSLIVVADNGGPAPLAMPGWGRHALRPVAVPDISPPNGVSTSAGRADSDPASSDLANSDPPFVSLSDASVPDACIAEICLSDISLPDIGAPDAAPSIAVSLGSAFTQSVANQSVANQSFVSQPVAPQSFAAQPLAAVAQKLADVTPFDHAVPEASLAPEASPVFRTRLTPHLRRAVKMRACLATARMVQAASEAALRAADTGVIVVTPGGRIVYADRTAHNLAGLVGLQLASARGGLQASEPETTHCLHSLIHDAAAGGEGGDLLMRANDGCAVAVAVRALPEDDVEDAMLPQELWHLPGHGTPGHGALQVEAAKIMVTLHRLARVPACSRRVAALFGLTRSEADVAVAVSAGQPVAAVAAVRGVSASTVQGQVRSALVKTGVPGVQELALLFARLG